MNNNTLRNYASEFDDGTIVKGVINNKFELILNWTCSVWEDGIPIIKQFHRCENPILVKFYKGQSLSGVKYTGYGYGSHDMDDPKCTMFDFNIGDIWYSAEGYDAEEILHQLSEKI